MASITLRRTLEQIKHCVEEALSVVERGEDNALAVADLEQAVELAKLVLQELPTGSAFLR